MRQLPIDRDTRSRSASFAMRTKRLLLLLLSAMMLSKVAALPDSLSSQDRHGDQSDGVYMGTFWSGFKTLVHGKGSGLSDRLVPNICACREVASTFHHPPNADSTAEDTCLDPVPLSQYSPVLARESNDAWLWCFLQSSPQSVKECLTPERDENDEHSPRALFMIGDSHGAQLLPMLTTIADKSHMRLAWFAQGSCGYADDEDYERCPGADTSRAKLDEAKARRAAVEDSLSTHLRRGDTVLLATLRVPSSSTLAYFDTFLVPLVKDRGATLVVYGDNPKLAERDHPKIPVDDPSVCMPTASKPHALESCETQRNTVEWWVSYDEKVIGNWADTHGGHVRFWSQWELWCDDKVCGSTVPGRRDTISYTHGSHLNEAGSLYVWPYFCAAMLDWGLLAH